MKSGITDCLNGPSVIAAPAATVFLIIPLQAELQGRAEGEIIPQQVIGEEEATAAGVQRCQLSRAARLPGLD